MSQKTRAFILEKKGHIRTVSKSQCDSFTLFGFYIYPRAGDTKKTEWSSRKMTHISQRKETHRYLFLVKKKKKEEKEKSEQTFNGYL